MTPKPKISKIPYDTFRGNIDLHVVTTFGESRLLGS